jgi:hypothetical protein
MQDRNGPGPGYLAPGTRDRINAEDPAGKRAHRVCILDLAPISVDRE